MVRGLRTRSPPRAPPAPALLQLEPGFATRAVEQACSPAEQGVRAAGHRVPPHPGGTRDGGHSGAVSAGRGPGSRAAESGCGRGEAGVPRGGNRRARAASAAAPEGQVTCRCPSAVSVLSPALAGTACAPRGHVRDGAGFVLSKEQVGQQRQKGPQGRGSLRSESAGARSCAPAFPGANRTRAAEARRWSRVVLPETFSELEKPNAVPQPGELPPSARSRLRRPSPSPLPTRLTRGDV